MWYILLQKKKNTEKEKDGDLPGTEVQRDEDI